MSTPLNPNYSFLNIDDLQVLFPFPEAYPEQKEYMKELKKILDETGVGVLEMPSGTGKTISLLSLIVAYMSAHEDVGPLLYCTRTINEMDQGMDELRKLINLRKEVLKQPYDENFLAISLSCRANLCINPDCQNLQKKTDYDHKCFDITFPWSENPCPYYVEQLLRPRPGVYKCSNFKDYGIHNHLCPYFLSRRLVKEANVIFGSFAYALDISASDIIFKNLSKNAIVVFDEAHNIDDVCCEFMSMFITHSKLEDAQNSIILGRRISHNIHKEQEAKLNEAFRKLQENLRDEDLFITPPETLDMFVSPVLPRRFRKKASKEIFKIDDLLDLSSKLVSFLMGFIDDNIKINPVGNSHVHGLIQNTDKIPAPDISQIENSRNPIENFSMLPKNPEPPQNVEFSESLNKSFIADFESNIKKHEIEDIQPQQNEYTNLRLTLDSATFEDSDEPTSEINPISQESSVFGNAENQYYLSMQILSTIHDLFGVNPSDLHYLYERFTQFLIKNKVKEFNQFIPLLEVLDFFSLIAMFDEGYYIFKEQADQGALAWLYCVDSRLAFRQALLHFSRIVITSGTLSPVGTYQQLLGFEAIRAVDFTMSLARECLLPLIIPKTDVRLPFTSSYKYRGEMGIVQSYGQLLLQVCSLVPDGVVCFFPSYVFMFQILEQWKTSGLIDELRHYKLVFREADNYAQTIYALSSYKKSVESGRGALFFGVARGRISEGIDFANEYGRCVLLFGLPVRNTLSLTVQARMKYVEQQFGIPESEFLLFDAMRAASQCVGRLLRSKSDFGIVVMADNRYARPGAIKIMPHWIKVFIHPDQETVTVNEAITKIGDFLRNMSQPFKFDPKNLKQLGKSTSY